MKDFIFRLSQGTGLKFRVDSDTCEPAAGGDNLNYWIASSAGGFHLVANSIFDEVYSGELGSETELIDKLNELENENRIVSR